jgi:hypothetical protein
MALMLGHENTLSNPPVQLFPSKPKKWYGDEIDEAANATDSVSRNEYRHYDIPVSSMRTGN